MKTNHKLTYAIMAALSAHAGASYAASDAGASSFAIEEVVVTATRRSESIQNVPITIQAITGDQLGELNVTSFDEVLRYLPNVTFGSNGPGQGNIFMRGLSAGFAGTQSSATIAPYPNVATYLDEQSVSFPFRNVDVYMVDMERLEVLEGPQGTLFGGGAEAGAVRYITNKPKLNATEAMADFSYGTTAHGDPNTAVSGVLNVPLINDKLAIRMVVYNDKRGGYIDNVPSTFDRQATDPGPASWGSTYPTNGAGVITAPSANNFAIAQRAQNPVTYTGVRISALWQVNDDWSVYLQQSYQNMEADGIFAQYPTTSDGAPLGPLQETSFSPAYNKDRYSSTAWTVNGKFGVLKAIYTGSYLTRNIDQNMDYANYSRTHWGFYYSCTGGGGTDAKPGTPATCYSPAFSWHDTVRSTHQSHEFRLSTPDEWRVRGLVGAFWENFEIYDNQNFLYKTVPACTATYLAPPFNAATSPPCFSNLTPLQAQNDPTTRNDNDGFGEDDRRGYKQTAFFASVDYDLIPKVLTVTVGTRWFRYEEDEIGSQWSTAGCVNKVPGVTAGCSLYSGTTPFGGTADNQHNKTYTGFKSRGNLTWHVTPDMMVYYTYSQGYRPGAFNRTTKHEVQIAVDGAGNPLVGPLGPGDSLVYQYLKPFSYAPDSLTNNELGWKAEFLDRRVLLNGSIYQMDWKNVQTEIFNPPVFGTATFGVAGPDYQIKGFELQMVARVTDALTVQGSLSYNDAKETNSPCLASAGVTSKTPGNPTPAGQCLSQYYGLNLATNVLENIPLQNGLGALNATPAFSPKVEFNLRARYDWAVNDYKAFVMVGGSHVGDMSNQPSSFGSGAGMLVPNTTWARYDQPGYTTYDAAFGLAKDKWSAELYGSNLSNSNASVFTSTAQYKLSEVPLRPRVLGLKLGYKF